MAIRNFEKYHVLQGTIAIQGTPSDLARNGVDLMTLVENETENVDKQRQSECKPRMSIQSSIRSASICSGLRRSTCSTEYGFEPTEAFNGATNAELMEAAPDEKSRRRVGLKYFKAGANWPFLCLVMLLFVFAQFLASASDIWVSIW